MPLLQTQHITKVFDEEGLATHALQGISITVNPGEFVAIMGPSGSGKSTLLHIVGLLDRPTNGQYFFQDRNVTDLSDAELAHLRNASIGFVFQAFNLLPKTSALDNVVLPLLYSPHIPSSQRHDLATKALEKVGMGHRLTHLSNQLSGGEKQRVAIARALVNNPIVIFADEPTGNLDAKTGQIVMDLFAELHGAGHTIVVITHETPVAQYASRIITLTDGQVVSDSTAEKITEHRFSK